MADLAAIQDRLEDGEVLPQVAERPVEADAVHLLHGPPVARADAKPQPPGGELIDGESALGHGQGVAGESRQDRGPELDPLRAGSRGGEDGERIRRNGAAGQPGDVQARLVRGDDGVDQARRVAPEIDVHADDKILHGFFLDPTRPAGD